MIINDKYIQIDIKTSSIEQKDILIAELSLMGFEFEEKGVILEAFIRDSDYNQDDVNNLLNNKDITYSLSIISNKNWNAEWEAGFQPVVVDDYCCIRAGFHPPVPGIIFDIIINPQMSFGTGHHATTYLMVEAMRGLDLVNKSVFDFGTGTGVLAILAEKMGASSVVAIDNDDWSIENAQDNFRINNCNRIQLHKSDTLPKGSERPSAERFDIILANINRNTLLKNLHHIKEGLTQEGIVLLSGLLEGDQAIILEAAEKAELNLVKAFHRDSWICLKMSSQSQQPF